MTDQPLEQFSQDQTLFSANQPIFDDQQLEEKTKIEAEQVNPKRSKKKLLIVAVVGFISVVTMIVLLIVIFGNGNEKVQQLEPSPSETTKVEGQGDVVFERLNQIKNDLDLAEPNNQNLPFPPVKMDINLLENAR